MDLIQVENALKKCKRCNLWKIRKNVVPGEGRKNAKIMLVGEAPGKEEDATGRPFVGRAGKLLNSILEEAKIKRSQLYITSVLKCHPPQNRKPFSGEIKECLPWLEKQIETIQPKIIGLMGNTAIKSLLGFNGITKMHGKTIEKNGKKFLLLFHPAAGVYNAKLIPKMKKDYAKLIEFV